MLYLAKHPEAYCLEGGHMPEVGANVDSYKFWFKCNSRYFDEVYIEKFL